MISDEMLDRLQALSDQCDSLPWKAMIEGKDHLSGDSFIMVGTGSNRDEDIYVTRDSGPAGDSYLELIAAARTYLPALIDEIRRLHNS